MAQVCCPTKSRSTSPPASSPLVIYSAPKRRKPTSEALRICDKLLFSSRTPCHITSLTWRESQSGISIWNPLLKLRSVKNHTLGSSLGYNFQNISSGAHVQRSMLLIIGENNHQETMMLTFCCYLGLVSPQHGHWLLSAN